jgi:hypothetical protein
MKKLFFLGIFLFNTVLIKSQNLVPNSDFETHIPCDSLFSFLSDAPPWSYFNGDQSPYFNSCNTQWPNLGVPINLNGLQGYQWPKSGNGYSGFNVYYQPIFNIRQYVQVQLNHPLKIGYLYCVEFYVNLANVSKYGTDRIGAFFSDTAVYCVPNSCLLNYIPQVSNKRGSVITDTLNWTKIEGSFIAAGNEKYITIGNFYPDDSVSKIQINTQPYSTFYYIDDVSVKLCDSTEAVGLIKKNEPLKIYPNPTNDLLTIDLPLTEDRIIFIYDTQGRKVHQAKLIAELNTPSLSYLDAGIYQYSVSINDQQKSGKLTIIK